MFKIKKIAGVVSAVAVTSVLTVSAAYAAVDTGPIDDLLADVASIGAAVMGVLIAIAGIKYIRRAL
ncbi:MAG: major capsid protein [Methylococcales bacterium]|nr:major capsid protein [Methylococcales bacterium]